MTAPSALAHGGGDVSELPRTEKQERDLRAEETQALGAAHAREHAIQRRALQRHMRRWRRLSPAQRQRRLAAERRRAVAYAKKTKRKSGPERDVGAWTTAPFPIPNYAIHSAVLPTGKVLFWGYPPISGGQRTNIGLAALFDPKTGKSDPIPLPQIDVDGNGALEAAPIYCSGQSFLPSGELLIAGGNLLWASQSGGTYTGAAGASIVFTFDPFAEKFVRQPNMRHGRWYPSQVELADGRTVLLSGYTEEPPGSLYNLDLEVFNPGATRQSIGTISLYPGGEKLIGTYPHAFTLPSGNLLLAGPGTPLDSAILDTNTFTWTQLGGFSRQRDKGTGVLLPGGPAGSYTAIQTGGFDYTSAQDATGTYPATATSEQIDAGAASPQWVPGPSLNVARSNHNTVLLPDGSMVTIGGGRGYSDALGGYETYGDGSARRVEIRDPVSGAWRLGPAQLEDRAYHSTAVLLPDGRVMSAGDDFHPSVNGDFSSTDTAEIYSPPYLFVKGKRPAVKKAPRAISWGQKFEIKSKSRKLKRAVLMAPDATTHGVDMQQRHVELKVMKGLRGAGLKVKAPPSGGVAPPGYYMLFLINKRGEPSVARWLRLGAKPASKTRGKRNKRSGKN